MPNSEEVSDFGSAIGRAPGAEFFVYECSENDGMETWVETYKETDEYDRRECETLSSIVGWGTGWPRDVGGGR